MQSPTGIGNPAERVDLKPELQTNFCNECEQDWLHPRAAIFKQLIHDLNVELYVELGRRRNRWPIEESRVVVDKW